MNSENLNDEILCIKAHNYNVGQHQRFHYTNAFLLPSDNQLLNQIANPKPKKDETDIFTPNQSEPGKQPEKLTKIKIPKKSKPKKPIKIKPVKDTTTAPTTAAPTTAKKRGRPPGSKDKNPRIRSEGVGVVTPHDAKPPTSGETKKRNKNLRKGKSKKKYSNEDL